MSGRLAIRPREQRSKANAPEVPGRRKLQPWIRAACAACAACFGIAIAQNAALDDLKSRAEAGDKGATRQVAEAYYLGNQGAEQNFAEAARWYLKLAQQGDVRAQTALGLMYDRGDGVAKDPAAAHRWWSFAAAANDPGAQYNLGLAYARGDGVAQDFAQAA